MSTSGVAGSTWATWPLIVGIVIPIAGLAILSALGTVFFLRHRRRERGQRLKDAPFNKNADLERNSESSTSSTNPSLPAASRARSERLSRPPRIRINTQERIQAIAKERLETIQESMRPSEDVQAQRLSPRRANRSQESVRVQAKSPMPVTSAQIGEVRDLILMHNPNQSQGDRTASSHSLNQDTLRWLSSGAVGSSHQSSSLYTHTTTTSTRDFDFELNDLQPMITLREEQWKYERKQQTGLGLMDVDAQSGGS